MKYLFTLLCLYCSDTAIAATNCHPHLKFYDDTQVHRDAFKTGECFVSVHTAHSGMVYRNFLITDDGLLMVFNSYGDGEDSNLTSARNFYFFPRKDKGLEIKHDPINYKIHITLPNQKIMSFNSLTSQISEIQDGQVSVADKVSPDNRGGVEFRHYKGLYLDAGYAVGHSSIEDKDRWMSFIDRNGRSCKVKNTEIFDHNSGDEILFKYNDTELARFLQKRCPLLENQL